MNTNTLFFGFALADSMFGESAIIKKISVPPPAAKVLIAEAQRNGNLSPCLNPSHAATIDAMRARYGIDVAIPEKAPQVQLDAGDAVLVMGVRGLPRLDATRHEYTQEEIDGATFVFSLYEVQKEIDYTEWAGGVGRAFR